MKRRRARQLKLAFGAETATKLSKEKEREVVEALAELLLAAVIGDDGDDRRKDNECENHR
jgi:lauroyl/myristoyl acyltransferase